MGPILKKSGGLGRTLKSARMRHPLSLWAIPDLQSSAIQKMRKSFDAVEASNAAERFHPWQMTKEATEAKGATG